MRSILFTFLVASLFSGSAIAQDLGTSRELPVKNTPIVIYEPPAVPRQGGDTIEDATVIPSLPFTDTGTTDGYIDDYDEVCPYTGSTSPDVVYTFTPTSDIGVDIDLCGSGYDTKVYIYDVDLNLIDCNDDAYFSDLCGIWVSKIENASLLGGITYYIVIDGYGGDSGPYVLSIEEWEQCFVYCPEDAVPEGEPPLHDGYQDAYNGGCYSPEFGNPFQAIRWLNYAPGHPLNYRAWLCGRSGWYLTTDGSPSRDMDWFQVRAAATDLMEVTLQSEFPCYVFKLSETNCADIEVVLQTISGCETPTTLSFPVLMWEYIWLVVAPTIFEGPVPEFTYFMTVSNVDYHGGPIPIEGMSWGGVKALYR